MKHNYIIAIYLRISMEDGDNHTNGKEESDSIGNQRNYLNQYIQNHEEFKLGEIIEICDDGYSGANFQRPEIQKLLEMAHNREIDCIMVKDFSRFGRNYIEVSDYIDQIFPLLGIRFISVNDHYDSGKLNGTTGGVDIAFRNIVYGYYSRDISEKEKSARKTKAERGDYLSPYAPIGYRKSEKNKNKLVVEEESAAVVKRIFQMAGSGWKPSQIAKLFNTEEVPTPSQLKRRQGINHPWRAVMEGVWGADKIGNILRDERYLGKMIYRKRYRTEVGNRKQVKSEKKDWIVAEHTHEPLVTQEEFWKAQEVMAAFREKNFRVYNKHLFSGKLRCGVCGYLMRRTSEPSPCYYCGTRYTKKECGCLRGSIDEAEIAGIVFSVIRSYTAVLDRDKMLRPLPKPNKASFLRKQIKEYVNSCHRIEERKAELYDQYAEEQIDRDSFIKQLEDLNQKQGNLQTSIEKLKEEITELSDGEREDQKIHLMSEAEYFLKIKELTKEMVESFVDSIDVSADHSIQIQWRFGHVE